MTTIDASQHEGKDRPGATPYDQYAKGSKDPQGRRIKIVIGRHRHLVVYITEQDEVGWNYDELPERLRPAIAELQRLKALGISSLPRNYHPQFVMHLASGLYGALLSNETADLASFFDVARTLIETKSRERARLHYVGLSSLFALVVVIAIVVASTWIPADMKLLAEIVRGMGGGAVGAMTSIIQRGRDLKIDPATSAFDLALQGLLRVFLGTIFGAFIVVASLSNIAFGNFQGNPTALLALTVVAGFSERLVPDLIERTAKVSGPGEE
jgi:hypothetical protein